jgi:transcriptional regulator with XRE-family HTH domain
MGDLRGWLRTELKERGLTQAQVAVYARVGQATISDRLRKGHVPKVDTLFRLADYFHVPRERVLRLAGHLPPVPEAAAEAEAGEYEDPLVEALVKEFRRVPDEWKEVVVEQVAQYRRLAAGLTRSRGQRRKPMPSHSQPKRRRKSAPVAWEMAFEAEVRQLPAWRQAGLLRWRRYWPMRRPAPRIFWVMDSVGDWHPLA